MHSDPNDPEIRAFIMTCGLETYSPIAERIVALFGEDRAWSVPMIRAFRAEFPARIDSRYQADPAVVAFVRDRVGLTTLDKILEAGRAQFSHHRFPSRGALGRMMEKIRAGTPMVADGVMGHKTA